MNAHDEVIRMNCTPTRRFALIAYLIAYLHACLPVYLPTDIIVPLPLFPDFHAGNLELFSGSQIE